LNSYSLSDIDEQWTAVNQATLVFVVENDSVLLIRKKRGLGAGKINGPGGKLEAGESAIQCACREVDEELCIRISEVRGCGRLRFQFADHYSIDVQVFIANQYSGSPTETDEAVPLWFNFNDIPYADMWEDDVLWLPRVLAGDCVDGRFVFDGDKMLAHELVFNSP